MNITVQEYSYGGYTKISNSEYAASGYSNKGSVFSKFAYRKMVYDLYGAWDWCDSHDVGSSVYSTYRLPSGTVERDQVWLKTEDFGYLSVPVTLRATYATEKVQLVNMAGFSFFDNRRTVSSRLTFSDAPGTRLRGAHADARGQSLVLIQGRLVLHVAAFLEPWCVPLVRVHPQQQP